jgi:DNA replication protein DnaC
VFDLTTMEPMKRHWLTKGANIPMRYQKWDFQNIVDGLGKLPFSLTDWFDDLTSGKVILNLGDVGTTGVGLLLDGAPGRGKTTHAVSVLNEFVRAIPDDKLEACRLLHVSPNSYGLKFRPVYYLTMTDLLYRTKALFDADSDERARLQDELDGFYGRARDDAYNVRLLVLDDVGKEYGSEYDKFSFDSIIRMRYDKGLPTIITTNVDLNDWDETYSEAMQSFAHEAFRRVKLGGEDLRKAR